MPLIIVGVVLIVAILGFVNQLTLFGSTCFFIGSGNAQSGCIPPILYYGALGLALLIVIAGIVKIARASTTN